MLDPLCLRAFIAVAELGHFVRAADLLGVTQSVISKRLQRLEDQLGVRLIERGKRNRVQPTRAGTLFLAVAREGMAGLEQMERLGRNIARGEAGPIRIGYVFSAIMTGVLPRMIRALRDRLPDLEVHPKSLETPEQLMAIGDGRIDFGIIRPRPSYPPGIAATSIHRESVIVAMAADHPLAAAGTIPVQHLGGNRFIVPQFHEEVGLIDIIRGIARAGRFEMPDIIRTTDFITAAGLAAAGVGIAAVPGSLEKLHLDGLAYRQIANHAMSLDLVLVHRADGPQAALAVMLEAAA
ncbi:LysR substrate-binding domain-containing protein [Novosphingobium sp.]|uniref:LysR substrate-binding domain-containing protein n=1 Tax=Novosphingobium sp. TaxID=1874826 RepID=UPI002FDB6FB5